MNRKFTLILTVVVALGLATTVYFVLSGTGDEAAVLDGASSAADSGGSLANLFGAADADSSEFGSLAFERNALTNEAYTPEQIERIEYLAGQFPDNVLIPRPEGDPERQRREEEARRAQRLQERITAGEADTGDVGEYFEYRTTVLDDRLELIDFVLAEDQWPEEVRRRYVSMREYNKEARERLEDQRRRTIEALEVRSVSTP